MHKLKMYKAKIFTLLGMILVISGFSYCSNNSETGGNSKKDYLITIKTDYGEMKAILYDETPKHKANFVKLAEDGFYDGVLFHRVIKNFMIQGGDPKSKEAQSNQPLGDGGPGYRIPAEFNEKLFHQKGALSAARMGDNTNPDRESSGSQFYIVHGKTFSPEELTTNHQMLQFHFRELLAMEEFEDLRNQIIMLQQNGDFEALQKKIIEYKPIIEEKFDVDLSIDIPKERLDVYAAQGGAPHLDDQYTVFGQVIEGLDVLDKIATLETDQRDRPVKDVAMEVEVEEMSKKKITKLYGYEYEDPNI